MNITVNGHQGQIGKIVRTHLGLEDHGIFTASFTVEGAGWGQGLPMMTLGDKGEGYVRGLLSVVGVHTWEELVGQQVIVLRGEPYGSIVGLANTLDPEKVFMLKELFS